LWLCDHERIEQVKIPFRFPIQKQEKVRNSLLDYMLLLT
jgi:hypothetical protein